jgi:hypothetical protein
MECEKEEEEMYTWVVFGDGVNERTSKVFNRQDFSLYQWDNSQETDSYDTHHPE